MEWQEIIDTNLNGLWLSLHAALPIRAPQASELIVIRPSLSGRHGFSMRTPYEPRSHGKGKTDPSGIAINYQTKAARARFVNIIRKSESIEDCRSLEDVYWKDCGGQRDSVRYNDANIEMHR